MRISASSNRPASVRDDGLRQLVLNIEELLDAAVEALAPQMVARSRVDQLRRDANPLPILRTLPSTT